MLDANIPGFDTAWDEVEPLEQRQFFWLSPSCNPCALFAAGPSQPRKTCQAIGNNTHPDCNKSCKEEQAPVKMCVIPDQKHKSRRQVLKNDFGKTPNHEKASINYICVSIGPFIFKFS